MAAADVTAARWDDHSAPDDASRLRLLVSRYRPQYVSREDAARHWRDWLIALGPSPELRRLARPTDGSEPIGWAQYSARYLSELTANVHAQRAMDAVAARVVSGVPVTFLCQCRDLRRCHASVLAAVVNGRVMIWAEVLRHARRCFNEMAAADVPKCRRPQGAAGTTRPGTEDAALGQQGASPAAPLPAPVPDPPPLPAGRLLDVSVADEVETEDGVGKSNRRVATWVRSTKKLAEDPPVNRTCLKCDKPFASKAGARLCKRCREANNDTPPWADGASG